MAKPENPGNPGQSNRPENTGQGQGQGRGRSGEARDPNRPQTPVLDADGNPVLDEDGNPLFEKEGLGRPDRGTEG